MKYGREVRKLLTYMADKEGPISPEILEESAGELKQYGVVRYSTYEEFYDIIKDLSMADFIERNSVFTNYYLIGDPVLKRYLQLQYEWEIRKRPITEVEDEERMKLQHRIMELKSLLGFLFESHVKHLMSLWNGDSVDGTHFGIEDKVFLPRFSRIYSTMVKAAGGRAYEVDIYASPFNLEDPAWVVECRYRNRKANANDIDKFHDVLKSR